MSKMIQIRNVPDGVHATLKARAALAARLLRRSGVRLTTSPAKAVRAERDRR